MAIVNTKGNEASQIATDSFQILKHRNFCGMMIGELESLGLTEK
ncbi:hypothetical protein [Methanosarcina sp. UBA5]|nr:hypothetical protein [Methanosarcina sp. UBA5]